jgi:hypothetical protein
LDFGFGLGMASLMCGSNSNQLNSILVDQTTLWSNISFWIWG